MNKALSISKDHPPFLVIMPAKDEARSVGAVVRRLKSLCNCEVVVVDDLSTDDTASEARRAGATVLSPILHLGAWGAIQTGFRYGLRHGYQMAVTFDADGQHLPESLPDLMAPLLAGETDMAIGACPGRGSYARRFAWKLFRLLSGLRFEDLTSGLRAYNRRTMAALLTDPAVLLDYQDVGVLILVNKLGLRIREVETSMCTRTNGCSRVFHSWVAVFEYMLKSLLICFSKSLSTRSRPLAQPKEAE